MSENKALSQLTIEELNKRKKQSIGVMISFGIVMFIATVVLVYLSFKTKKYALSGVAAALFCVFIPIYVNNIQINQELKSRQSKKE
ncbi:MAG: hypothetical protein ACN6ON_15835 [Sphingobacterium sp.]